MKRIFSPAFFVLAAAAFFLPFVSVSCNADALQGFSEGLGDLGGDTASQIPQGNVEILSATGWQIVTNAPDVNDELPSSGGASADTGDLKEVQPFAIVAFGLAVLGIFLSLLRGKVGSALALALGVGGAVALFLMKQKFEGGGGQAVALAGLDISWKSGFWGSLGLLAAAGVSGLVAMLTGRGPGIEPIAAGGGFPSSTPPAAPPPSPPPTGGFPPPVPPAATPETPPSV